MSQYHRRQGLLGRIIMLIAIPLALSGTGYALFSQQLSVNSDTRKVAYSSSQNLFMYYDKQVAPVSGLYQYTINPLEIVNQGTRDTMNWQVAFDLPSDATSFACGAGITCTKTGSRVTVVNATPVTGFIAAGSMAQYSLTFRTANSAYTLENVTISGTLHPPYQPMGGLNVTVTQTLRLWLLRWSVNYRFDITNNTGQTISAWRIRAPYNSTPFNIGNIPTTVNYIDMPGYLMITSKTPLANGASFRINTAFTMSQSGWTIAGTTIEGAP